MCVCVCVCVSVCVLVCVSMCVCQCVLCLTQQEHMVGLNEIEAFRAQPQRQQQHPCVEVGFESFESAGGREIFLGSDG